MGAIPRDRYGPVLREQAQELFRLVEAAWVLQPDRRAVAAPGPVRRVVDEAGAHGVQRDVADDLPQVALADHVDEPRPVPDEVASSGPPGIAVAPARETAVQLAHPVREAVVRELDKQV